MDRRLVIAAGGGTATMAALATPAIAQANPEIRWRMPSSFPRNLDVLYGSCERLGRRVAELTDGKFRITPFPSGEIVPSLQVLDAVQQGSVECGHSPALFYYGKEPALAFFTCVPMGMNRRQMAAWMRYGDGLKLANEMFDQFNCIFMNFGDTGTQMGGWFRKEIRTVDDLKGLKFRIAGLAGLVFERLGSVPTQIAPGDIYPSLERGVIDAAEFIGPYDDEKLGLNKSPASTTRPASGSRTRWAASSPTSRPGMRCRPPTRSRSRSRWPRSIPTRTPATTRGTRRRCAA